MQSIDKNTGVLTIVIPCYNEENNIYNLVKKVLESLIPNKEIIIVDDKSTDGTHEILENKIKPLVSKIIYHKNNGGKGDALRTDFKNATGDVVIVQDTDLEYNPMDYSRIAAQIFKGEADVVYGSRFLNTKAKGYLQNRLANKFLTKLSNFFTHLNIIDMEICY